MKRWKDHKQFNEDAEREAKSRGYRNWFEWFIKAPSSETWKYLMLLKKKYE